MPEGDTVFRTAAALDRALTGHVLHDHRLPRAPARHLDLTGGVVVRTLARGKHC